MSRLNRYTVAIVFLVGCFHATIASAQLVTATPSLESEPLMSDCFIELRGQIMVRSGLTLPSELTAAEHGFADNYLWLRNARVKVVWTSDMGEKQKTFMRTDDEGRFVARETFPSVLGPDPTGSICDSGAYAKVYVRFSDSRLKVLYSSDGSDAEMIDPPWNLVFDSKKMHLTTTSAIYGPNTALRFDPGYAWDLNNWIPGAMGSVTEDGTPYGLNSTKGLWWETPIPLGWDPVDSSLYDRICADDHLDHIGAEDLNCRDGESDAWCLDRYHADVARYCEEFEAQCLATSSDPDSAYCEQLKRCPFEWYQDSKARECSLENPPWNGSVYWSHGTIWVIYGLIFDYFEDLGPRYAFNRQVQIKYPHDNKWVLDSMEGSFAHPGSQIIRIVANDEHNDFGWEALVHELMHVWAYQHSSGESCLTEGVIFTFGTHKKKEWPCVAFHEGFAGWAEQQVRREVFHAKMSKKPYSRKYLYNTGKVKHVDQLDNSASAWKTVFNSMLTKDFHRVDFGTKNHKPVDAPKSKANTKAYFTDDASVSCSIEPWDLEFEDVLAVFLRNTDASLASDRIYLNTRKITPWLFLERGARVLSDFSADAATYLPWMINPTETDQPKDLMGCSLD